MSGEQDKGEDQKWYFGPLWDFSASFQREEDALLFPCSPAPHYAEELWDSDTFRKQLAQLWYDFKAQGGVEDLIAIVNQQSSYLTQAGEKQIYQFPMGVKGDVAFGQDYIISHIQSRTAFMDEQLSQELGDIVADKTAQEAMAAPLGCSINPGSEVGEIGLVAFYAGCPLEASPGASIDLYQGDEKVASRQVFTLPGDVTRVWADFTDELYAPLALTPGEDYHLVIDAEMLSALEYKNSEWRVDFRSSAITQYITVSQSVQSVVTTPEEILITPMFQSSSEQSIGTSACVQCSPIDENWEVAVKVNGTTAATEDNVINLTNLRENTSIEVTHSLAIPVVANVNVGVELTPEDGSPYYVSLDGNGTITASGLRSGDNATLYALNGALISRSKAIATTVSFKNLTPSSTYLLVISPADGSSPMAYHLQVSE